MLRQLCCHFYLSKISRRRRATSLERALTGSWEPSRSRSRSPESDAKCQLQKLHTHACYCQVTGTDTDSYSHSEKGEGGEERTREGVVLPPAVMTAQCHRRRCRFCQKRKITKFSILILVAAGDANCQASCCCSPTPLPASLQLSFRILLQIGGNTSATPTQQLNVCLGARCACPWLAK